MIKICIPLPPVSKKNSQRIVKAGTRHIPLPSKKYAEYEGLAGYYLPKIDPIDYPVTVKCLFFMPTHRRCDLTNMLEAIDDTLVKYQVLKDDNCNIIVSHDGSRVKYDKYSPRTEIYIERYKENE